MKNIICGGFLAFLLSSQVNAGILTLFVDRTDGSIQITNTSEDPVTFIVYGVVSYSYQLDEDAWYFLSDREHAGPEEAEILDGADWKKFSQLNQPPLSFVEESYESDFYTTLDPNESIFMGNAFPLFGNEDLEFVYREADQPAVSGEVVYVPEPTTILLTLIAITVTMLFATRKGY